MNDDLLVQHTLSLLQIQGRIERYLSAACAGVECQVVHSMYSLCSTNAEPQRRRQVYVEPEGTLIAFVVSVQPSADGAWQLTVRGPQAAIAAKIMAAHFVLRMWRAENGVLRGNVRRQNSDIVAPFQCNEQMRLLIQNWLKEPIATENTEDTE